MSPLNRRFPNLMPWLLSLVACVVSLASPPDIRWRAGGHFLAVESMEFSPDGQRIVSASSDVDVKLWEVASRRLLWTSAAGRFGPSGISVAPDFSYYLASASELDTNLVVQELTGDYAVRPLGSLRLRPLLTAISPSGLRAAAFGQVMTPALDRHLRVWNVATGADVASPNAEALPGGVLLERIEFLTEDELILGDFQSLTRWSLDGTVRWSRSTASPNGITFEAVSPDRTSILVQEEDRVKLLDASTGEPRWSLNESLGVSWRFRFNADGTRFVITFSATVAEPGRLEIRSTGDGTLVRVLPIPFQRPVPAFSPDGTSLACGHSAGIHLTSLAGEAHWEPLTESWSPLTRIAVGSAQNWVAAIADSSRVDLRHLESGERFRSLETDNPLAALVAAPDGSWLAFTTQETNLARYRPATDSFDVPPLPTRRIGTLAVSADGSRLLAAPSDTGATMIDTANWQVTAQLRAPQGHSTVVDAVWSADAARLTTTSPGGVALTYSKDGADPQFTNDWAWDRIASMRFLPDGDTILSLHRSGQLRRWRVSDGAILSERNTGVVNPSAAAFSPDHRLLVASAIGDPLRVFNTDTGAEVDHWTREAGYQIRDLEFSSDGAWLVNARLDGALIGFRAPFLLFDSRVTSEGVEFSVSGGAGPYQWQRHPTGPGSWSAFGSQFTGRTVSIPDDGSGPWLFRLVEVP